MNINIDEVGELLNKPRIFFQELLNEVEKKYKVEVCIVNHREEQRIGV